MSQTLSRPYHPVNQAQVFKCIVCEEDITTESSQRGLPRTKCDKCKKEKDRLINMINHWEKKVGIRIQ